MPDLTIPEPGDRALVMWLNAGGKPAAVYTRIDEFATETAPEERWFNADEDQAGREDTAWTWVALNRRMRLAFTGPYPLNVGELLGGTDG
jgi:hypothetical protein